MGTGARKQERVLGSSPTDRRAVIARTGDGIDADVDDQGGLLIIGLVTGGATYEPLQVDATGRLIVSVSGATPGATITNPADTAVGIGATVALPTPPAGTTRMIVQNTSAAGVEVRIRVAAGTAGAGTLLFRGGFEDYEDAIAALEAEHVAGVAATVMIRFEGP